VKVVVDTNVIISGLTSPEGKNRRILHACIAGTITPLLGMALFSEIEDVAFRKETLKRCPVSKEEVRILLNAMYANAQWIRIYFLWRPNLPDESDNHLLELAIAGQAQCLITNNLKDVNRGELFFPSLYVLHPADFVEDYL
jgi:putative PIN family toxin of toxin-antitoxin system